MFEFSIRMDVISSLARVCFNNKMEKNSSIRLSFGNWFCPLTSKVSANTNDAIFLPIASDEDVELIWRLFSDKKYHYFSMRVILKLEKNNAQNHLPSMEY